MLNNSFKNLINSDAIFGRGQNRVLRAEPDDVFDLFLDLIGLGTGQIDVLVRTANLPGEFVLRAYVRERHPELIPAPYRAIPEDQLRAAAGERGTYRPPPD